MLRSCVVCTAVSSNGMRVQPENSAPLMKLWILRLHCLVLALPSPATGQHATVHTISSLQAAMQPHMHAFEACYAFMKQLQTQKQNKAASAKKK